MGYIKVILLVNIGLTFAIEIIHSNYRDEEIEVITKKIPDEYLDKDIIHFPNYIYPTHYKVQLTVDTKSSYPMISLSGQVNINITILRNKTRTLLLHAKNIQLDNFRTTLSNSEGIYFVDKSYTVQAEFLAIKFTSTLPHGNYCLTAVFGSTANYSFIRNELPHEYKLIGHKNDLIMTQFGKTAARYLFPCWDDPAYKTTFDIEVTHEAEYTVLSNMPVSENCDANNDHIKARMKCTKFITTPIIATHQLVILLKPFNLIFDPRETVHTWHKSARTSIISLIHSTANNISKLLREYTRIPLDNQKINHVLIPNAPYSKAQLGLIIYRESDVIYENKDLLEVKSEVMSTIESQIARQWFGGLVTPKFWNDSWLTESFALYFSHYFPKQAELWDNFEECEVPFDKAVLLKIVENYNDVMRIDIGSMPPVLSGRSKLKPTSAVYHKGAFILRMFSLIVSEVKFREIIIDYLNIYKYGLVTSDDLWSILKVTVFSDKHFLDNFLGSSVDVIKDVIKPWITQKGFPIINVTIDRRFDEVKFIQHSSIDKSLYNRHDIKDDLKWWIPLTFMTTTRCDTYYTYNWLNPDSGLRFQLNYEQKDSWIIVNVGQTGYYRVLYERQNWEKLGDFLNNKNYSRIPVINRAQLINDICDEYKNQRTDWNLFEKITSYLSRETNYIPWVPMLKCLDMLAEFFKLPESKLFQLHIADYFSFILTRIGYEENPNHDDFTRKARQNLASYACTLGNSRCRSAAADKLKKYLEDPTIYKILPWWEDWTFCFGLKTKNVSIWEQVYQLYAETKKKTILNSLSCTEDPNIIIKLLHIIIENSTLIEEADQANLFNTIIKQHISNNQIFSYIMDNIKILKPKSISLTDAYDTIIMNIYSDKQLDNLYNPIMTAIDDSNEFKAKQNKMEQQQKKIQDLRSKIDMMFPNKTPVHYVAFDENYNRIMRLK